MTDRTRPAAADPAAGLVLRDVVLSYPDGGSRITALDRVGLAVAPGELTAVVGPSGSGKSSLLAVAATLLRPDSGQVLVGGQETGALSAKQSTALRRKHIGVVFQQSNLLASLTAVEQLLVVAHLSGGDRRAARARAERLLDSVGLAGRVQQRRPHQLSGGERQRVNIARALYSRPTVLLVDEPTSALDHERGARIMALLADATREHTTATLLVTHDRALLDRADRVLSMQDGRLEPAARFPDSV
ncbi:ABC transporter ATP-binding protein [Streptacidiphilus sp. PB12-B1b]|uniref:ABC transporter ATP-binding protein n=1 Tax=Streptacidiphilus sp. PB12-B1b TaxID=2705012 RepID=UPI0015F99CFD|nr:ABC transporter ATP-binding protein [Streptacidiphilus sp. PB12-B1b]QMU75950.1 ABC transporter ATP-binding protein [Streptacidiphilus sp. PB12-B1b]